MHAMHNGVRFHGRKFSSRLGEVKSKIPEDLCLNKDHRKVWHIPDELVRAECFVGVVHGSKFSLII